MRGMRARGFTLLEILMALAIGALLLGAFLQVLQNCRHQFAMNESLAQLQDAQRVALNALTTDIEHAGFLGFSSSPESVRLVVGAHPAHTLADAAALRQFAAGAPLPPVDGLPDRAHVCGSNFAVDVSVPIEGSDNAYAPGVSPSDCDPTESAGGAVVGSDTLTVRHASLQPVTASPGRLQLYASRHASQTRQELFADGTAPGLADDDHAVHDFEVRTYYLANDSVGRRGWPALRVKALTEAGGSAQFRDEEVQPGVEDLQVQFGIVELHEGAHVLRFVTPDDPALQDARVLAARLWLRVRAEAEAGFTDARTWEYAGVTFEPGRSERSLRRSLVMRTVVLRNARVD